MPTFRFEFLDGEASPPITADMPTEEAARQPSDSEASDRHGRQVWVRPCPDRHSHYCRMGHGTPIDASAAEGGSTAGPFMLDVGISSTLELARSWGIAPIAQAAVSRPAARIEIPEDRMRVDPMGRPPKP